jgi:AcrR family transcriptional regulator
MPAARPTARRREPEPLPERLVEAVEKILEEDGLVGLSLREVARRAGVTHGAPLRHFPSFATLLAEVAARGFRTLAAAVESAAASVPAGGGATARLEAAARAYLACAIERPERFALMFRPELLDPTHEGFAREGRAAFDGLVRQVRGAQDAGWRTDADARVLAGSLWASIHGFASLWAQGAYAGAVQGVSLEDATTSLIDLLLGAPSPSPRARGENRRRT